MLCVFVQMKAVLCFCVNEVELCMKETTQTCDILHFICKAPNYIMERCIRMKQMTSHLPRA